ncbi:glutathione S-transferase family protein [Bradyrhizobium sp.]|uniref:glutathione S-transferase family protein n=1 Tax=Bradyrhizobium sp. TaxID=376 RepID=UPI0025BF497C|nr:glutathione S-transferase family protein [Bradyrhizobium sp.]
MMHDLQLYTFKLCPYAHRVRLALAEKGQMAEQIEIDLKNKPADFTTLSPHGRVPLLVHGGLKLWESAVILEYLDEAFPEHPLMPSQPADRANARLWIDFANSRLFAATHRLIFATDEAIRRELIAEIVENVRFLEHAAVRRREGGPYLLGTQFTLADIALYPWFEQAAALAHFSAFKIPTDCSGVARWCDAVATRPAVQGCARSDDWYVEGYQRYLGA